MNSNCHREKEKAVSLKMIQVWIDRLAMAKELLLILIWKTFSMLIGVFCLFEIRALTEQEIKKYLMQEDSMGFDCKHRVTDNTNMFVTWRYEGGIERHAMYYLGCKNSVSDKLRSTHFEFLDDMKSSVAEKEWIESESRFGVDKQ